MPFRRLQPLVIVAIGVFFVQLGNAQQFEVPGRDEYAKIKLNGPSVLPSGRYVKPAGELKLVTRAPYGLAVSKDERTAVVLHSNAISIVDLSNSEMAVSRFPSYDGKNRDVIKGASFVGACFS
ncbi:MAG: hypothetical protein ACKOXR_05690, partial [Bacteroidota bacterium]